MKRCLLLVAACFLGCSGGGEPVTSTGDGDTADVQAESTPADAAFTHTISVGTEYYLVGPQQAQPPDGTFKAGTKVKLVEEAGSYCVVESEDGVTAHVAVDAVKLLDNGK